MGTDAQPIRVALLGYGFAGKTFHAPLIGATEGLDIVAVASRDPAKVHADLPDVDVVSDARQAIDDPRVELVVVATPNDTHAALASAALHAGKHVVVDKPFALDLAEARQLVLLATRCNRTLSVFQNRRWDSDFLGIKAAIDDGLAGNVTHFESHFDRFRPVPRDRWRERAGAGGGVWYDLGPHLIDQALLLFGLPERIQANLAIQRTGARVDDWAHVVLEYESRRVILHASMLVAGGGARFTVHGDRGSLVKQGADRQEAQLLAGMTPGAPGWGEDSDPMIFYSGDGQASHYRAPAGDQRAYYAQLRDALKQTGTNPVSPQQAVTVMAVLAAAIESSARACAISLSLSAEESASWPAPPLSNGSRPLRR